MSCNKNNIFVEYIKEWLSSEDNTKNIVKQLYISAQGHNSQDLDKIVAMYKDYYKDRYAPFNEPNLCNNTQLIGCIGSALEKVGA